MTRKTWQKPSKLSKAAIEQFIIRSVCTKGGGNGLERLEGFSANFVSQRGSVKSPILHSSFNMLQMGLRFARFQLVFFNCNFSEKQCNVSY